MKDGQDSLASSCSRNAHARKVLVRRAQSRIDQAALESEITQSPSLKRSRASLEGIIRISAWSMAASGGTARVAMKKFIHWYCANTRPDDYFRFFPIIALR